MANGFGSSALRWWAVLAQARSTGSRSGTRPNHRHLELPHDPAAGLPVHPLGARLAGAPEALTRLATVRPGTVGVLLSAGRPPAVYYPGDLLVPPLLTRVRAGVRALALSTAPVHLDVTVPGLVTLDRYTVEVIRLRLVLQLAEDDGYATAARLAAAHGAALDAVLLEQVRRECRAGAQGAVTMNRRADLQRLTLRRLLVERWLPPSFAGGLLLRRDVEVLEAGQATHEDEPTLRLPAVTGTGLEQPDEAPAEVAPMASPS